MIVALIDNGSLEPAAQLNLRALAATLSERTDSTVHAVSWKHSDRIPATALAGVPAWTLAPFVRAHVARGERDFVFIPFFVSPQGAIGSALRGDLEKLHRELGDFRFAFTAGLVARGAVAPIVADRIRLTIAAKKLSRPAVVVVDHGGPSAESAAVRDAIGAEVRATLRGEIGALAVASMEGAHGPLLAEQLAAPGFASGDIVIAPLFLAPGRHAGPDGDLARIARAAEERAADATRAQRCHFADLVGTHPRVADALSAALREHLSTLPAETLA
ncbi:MAG TPA: CbiX/SirB N-terminal domain-containing protein [Opitutaceae bacterium]|nr:CbiX/SirB N-terminal domain-containing protein [Opitutaceae bacterium]